MGLKILSIFLVTFLVSNSLPGQTKTFSDILPKGIEARPVLDTINYLPDTLKQPVLDILKSKGFDLSKCFADNRIYTDGSEKTISIRIWDVDDLKYRKNSEKSRKPVSYQITHHDFYSDNRI
ncbi:MAG: hypothetical protein ABI863_01965 [Ginsengibacter sp.]